jgi:hypothetical protein
MSVFRDSSRRIGRALLAGQHELRESDGFCAADHLLKTIPCVDTYAVRQSNILSSKVLLNIMPTTYRNGSGKKMNVHTQAINECKLGIKAYQNLVGSLHAFDQFLTLMPAGNHIVLSSVFCFAVIKYAKPFIYTETPFGKTRYPIRHLKGQSGFDATMHEHLLELRNTLIAHDDLESIEPRILSFGPSIAPSGFHVPVSIALSNKCLAYPITPDGVVKLKEHVTACVQGALNKLHLDIAKVRDAALKHPEHAVAGSRYEKNYGQAQIEEGGSHLQPPDFMRDEWLNSNAPNYCHIHNDLLYEELRIRRDFFGPEKIRLPDGSEIHLSPPSG